MHQHPTACWRSVICSVTSEGPLHPPTADLQQKNQQNGLNKEGYKRERLQFITFSFDTMAPSAFPDVCLKENMTLADRLYNLQLIQEFCKENLSSCCHFSLEDMLYASSTIKVLGETQPPSPNDTVKHKLK